MPSAGGEARRRRKEWLGLKARPRAGPIALDTAAFIYFIEEHERFLPVVAPFFEDAAAGRREIVTSALTLLEVLVVPLRRGNAALARRYELLLTRSKGLRLVEIDRTILRAAAEIRARWGARTPDAIQLASAIGSGCGAFVTNDRELPVIPGMPIIQLAD